jgi:hypothetical protein
LILRSRPGSDSYDLYEQLAVLSTALYRYGVIRGGGSCNCLPRLALILMSEECEDVDGLNVCRPSSTWTWKNLTGMSGGGGMIEVIDVAL